MTEQLEGPELWPVRLNDTQIALKLAQAMYQRPDWLIDTWPTGKTVLLWMGLENGVDRSRALPDPIHNGEDFDAVLLWARTHLEMHQFLGAMEQFAGMHDDLNARRAACKAIVEAWG